MIKNIKKYYFLDILNKYYYLEVKNHFFVPPTFILKQFAMYAKRNVDILLSKLVYILFYVYIYQQSCC